MTKLLISFLKDDSGATAVEYGILTALIAVVLITALTTLGNNLATALNIVSGKLPQS